MNTGLARFRLYLDSHFTAGDMICAFHEALNAGLDKTTAALAVNAAVNHGFLRFCPGGPIPLETAEYMICGQRPSISAPA